MMLLGNHRQIARENLEKYIPIEIIGIGAELSILKR